MLQRLIESLVLMLALLPAGRAFIILVLKQPRARMLEALITGYFLFTSICALLAFFLPLDELVFYGLLLLSTALLILVPEVRKGPGRQGIFPLLVVLTFASVMGSFPVKLPDEASYYLQSIFALREEGWVKGIANLEPRFALGSSFHVLGATTKAGHTVLKFNILLWAIAANTAFENLLLHKRKSAAYWLILSMAGFPVYFLLLPSQSPDLLGVLLTALLIEKLIIDKESGAIYPSLLFGVAILLKPNIAFSLAVLYLLGLITGRLSYKPLMRYSLLWAVPLLIFVGKNLVQTGYPFFPLDIFPADLPWTIPQPALSEALDILKSGHVSFLQPVQDGGWQQWLKMLFFQLGIKSILLWVVGATILSLLFYASVHREKKLLILCAFVLLTTPVWLSLNSVPNFRLGMHLFLPILSYLLVRILPLLKILWPPRHVLAISSAALGIVIIAAFALPGIELSSLVANPAYNKFEPLQPRNLVVPQEAAYPEKSCARAKFPCVSFDLYPGYTTGFEESEEYYYLREKENGK